MRRGRRTACGRGGLKLTSRTVPSRRRAAAIVPVVMAIATSGCAVSGLAFRSDDHIRIEAPGDRTKVALPFAVHFTTSAPTESVWAVVDGTPPRPGRGLRAYAVDADGCASDDRRCPAPDVLASRGIVPASVDAGRGTVSVATVRRSIAGSTKSELHRVTLFVLDASGVRPSEAAWSVDVRVEPRRFGL
jgi:hypothetical protein